MMILRAHVEGSVVVPDEPSLLRASDEVSILVTTTDAQAALALDQATREYYAVAIDDDDDDWGAGVTRDSRNAWDSAD